METVELSTSLFFIPVQGSTTNKMVALPEHEPLTPVTVYIMVDATVSDVCSQTNLNFHS